jgi:hypothetical protein
MASIMNAEKILKLIQRAGRLTRPHGRLRLTLSDNEITRTEMMHYLDRLGQAA